MSEQVFDFRKPGRLPEDVAHLLSDWQQQMRSALQLRWTRQLPFPFQVVALPPSLLTRNDLVGRWEHELVTYRVDVGEQSDPTVLLIARPAARAIVHGILGDVPQELSPDRALTDIERSLVEILLHEVQRALEESQPFPQPLAVTGRGEQLLKEMHKEFPEREPVAVVAFEVELPFGKQRLEWALSQAATLNLAAAAVGDTGANKENVGRLKEIVSEVPVEVVVRLGEAHLHLAELAELQVGDIVVLDQRYFDPLVAEVGGHPKFTGWPGRAGSKQAYQIESALD